MQCFTKRTLAVLFTIALASFVFHRVSVAQSDNDIGKRLTFLATFDDSFDADFAKGSSKMMTASNVGRSELAEEMSVPGVTRDKNGKYGKALSFSQKTKAVYCFAAENNFAYSENSFDATISFWMKADLTTPPPENKNYDKIPASKRPLIDAGNVKFSPDRWRHIVLVFKAINSSGKQSRCEFYIDGKKIGELDRSQKLTWNVKKAVIMLGIYFVGSMDDFAIFDSALTESQIVKVFKSPKSLKQLIKE